MHILRTQACACVLCMALPAALVASPDPIVASTIPDKLPYPDKLYAGTAPSCQNDIAMCKLSTLLFIRQSCITPWLAS
jgi:hypothetical protein